MYWTTFERIVDKVVSIADHCNFPDHTEDNEGPAKTNDDSDEGGNNINTSETLQTTLEEDGSMTL